LGLSEIGNTGVEKTALTCFPHQILVEDKIKNNEVGGACGSYGDRVLVGKPEEKRTLGIPSNRWKCNIKMDLQEVGW